MNESSIVRNISYSFFANLLYLVVSAVMVIIVPKLISLNDYGMWQLFLFYFSYLGFLHLGWEDGIYLRYAGNEFEELPGKRLSGQFYAIIFLQLVLATIVSVIGKLFIQDYQKLNVLLCAVWMAPLVNFNNLCNFILQITDRIREYAKLIALERLMLLIGVLLFITVLGRKHFLDMYIAQVGAIAVTAIAGSWFCRKIFFFPPDPLKQILQEAKKILQ